MVSTLCFDLDNTLYDKKVFGRRVYKLLSAYVAQHFGVDSRKVWDTLNKISRIKYSHYPFLFEDTLKKFHIEEPHVIDRLLKLFRSFKPRRLNLYSGVRSVLRRLHQKYQLALITDGHPEVQKNKLKALHIGHFFRKVIYTHQLGPDKIFAKPHPLAFRLLLKYFRIPAQEAVYIGDNPWDDFGGPLAVGMHCIRVLKGEYRKVKTPLKFRSRVLAINSLTDLERNLALL